MITKAAIREEVLRERLPSLGRRVRDSHHCRVAYALEQINTVQRIATRFDGLTIHAWPDDDLVRSTSCQLRSKPRDMQQPVSPESFTGDQDSQPASQSELADDIDAVKRMI